MTCEFDTNEFHILQDSLTGRNLIEASAGTGKTFTIENLYLRLLLEKEVDVQNILVVTFTEAATAELRERIRANLSQAFHDIEAWRKVQAQGNLALGPLVSNILFSISCYEKCVSKPEVPE